MSGQNEALSPAAFTQSEGQAFDQMVLLHTQQHKRTVLVLISHSLSISFLRSQTSFSSWFLQLFISSVSSELLSSSPVVTVSWR